MRYDFTFYSPEEELEFPLFRDKEVHVFIKRDDMIHPFISGNKWRKLKYPLIRALEQQKRRLVTFGGAWSNHLLATACAGAKFGFSTVGFVRGEQVSNPVLSMCQLYGMQLHFVSREAYLDKQSLYRKFYGAAIDFFIDEGGYGLDAANGCADLIGELDGKYEHIFVACGTGATVAGLLMGSEMRNPDTYVHGVPVLKNGGFVKEQVEQLGADSNRLRLHTEYHFGGYAKIKKPLLEFIKYFVSSTGIMLEPIYTGKACYALFDLVEKGFFKPGERVLLLHTGGLTGFLGMHHLFGR